MTRFFFQAEDGIRDYYASRGLGDVYKRQILNIAIFIQVLLGIITLMTGVEIKYASIHQLGSIFVLLSFLFIYYKNTN